MVAFELEGKEDLGFFCGDFWCDLMEAKAKPEKRILRFVFRFLMCYLLVLMVFWSDLLYVQYFLVFYEVSFWDLLCFIDSSKILALG